MLLGPSTVQGAETDKLLETVKSVGPKGEGHQEASRAVRQLQKAEAKLLPEILQAFDGANPLAENWLRSAVESIAERTIESQKKFPSERLEEFIRNRSHNPRARRLAYEWLRKVDPSAEERLIPGMLDDPNPQFRRDAVARLLRKAEAIDTEKNPDKAVRLYKKALHGAVHDDQVRRIVKPLEKLGHDIDLQKHFGFLTAWQIIGPFDNRDEKGFDAVYPPEEEIDLRATYEGQLGQVRWQPIATDDEYGIVNIAKQIENYKGSVMYLVTEFYSETGKPVQFRLGTPNAWKLWLNGELLFAREEYHRGMALDQYKVKANLRPGRNVIRLKICQNEQKQDWAQRYQFQLRVCNSTGRAVLSKKTVTADEIGPFGQ